MQLEKKRRWQLQVPFLSWVPDRVIAGAMVALPIVGLYLMFSASPRFDNFAERDAISARAEKVSVEGQRRRAIAAGEFKVSPTGETTFAIVRMEDRNRPPAQPSIVSRWLTSTYNPWFIGGVWVVFLIAAAVRRQRRLDAGLEPDDRRDDDDDDDD